MSGVRSTIADEGLAFATKKTRQSQINENFETYHDSSSDIIQNITGISLYS